MKLQDDIDFSALNWVKGELDATFKQARQALEAFVEDVDDATQMQFCANYLHQVQGTLQMVELFGARMVVEEMETIAKALLDNKISKTDEAFAVLMRGIVQLPDYLERLQRGHRDVPVVLLPLLNDLRAARGEKLLSETVLFTPDLSADLPDSAAGPRKQLADQKLRVAAAKLRQAFELGLLKWFKTQDDAKIIEHLKAICNKLRSITQVVEARRLWWIAGGVLDAMLDRTIEPAMSMKLLFGKVDRQIKRLALKGEQDFIAKPPTELTQSLLYYVAHADDSNQAIEVLKQTYQLSEMLPDAKELEHARGSMAGQNRELMQTVSVAIKEDLIKVKDGLDLKLRREDFGIEGYTGLIETLDRVANTLAMVGLSVPRKAVVEQLELLGQIEKGDHEVTENVLLDVAGALLYVDSSLDDYIEGVGSAIASATEGDEKTLPGSEVRKILDALMKEASGNLQEIKQSIVEFIEEPSDHQRVQQTPQLLEEIIGALNMLNLDEAAGLVNGMIAYTTVELVHKRTLPSSEQLDTLADALASIEYYLEAVREHRPGRDKILEVARISLDKLGYLGAAGERALAEVRAEEAAEIAEQAAQAKAETEPAAKVEPKVTAVSEVPAQSAATYAADISDDIDEEIREIFIEEVTEELEKLIELLPKWKANTADVETLTTIRRVFHTLKGSGRLVGALTIGEFGWQIENMLNQVLEQAIEASPAVFALMDNALAALPGLVGNVKGDGPPSADIEAIKKVAERISAGEDAWLTAVKSTEEPAQQQAAKTVDPTEISTPAEQIVASAQNDSVVATDHDLDALEVELDQLESTPAVIETDPDSSIEAELAALELPFEEMEFEAVEIDKPAAAETGSEANALDLSPEDSELGGFDFEPDELEPMLDAIEPVETPEDPMPAPAAPPIETLESDTLATAGSGSETTGLDPGGEVAGDFDFEFDELEADLVPSAAAVEPVLETSKDPEAIAATPPSEALGIEALESDELATLSTESETTGLDPGGDELGDFDFEFDELEADLVPSAAAIEPVLDSSKDAEAIAATPPSAALEIEALESDQLTTVDTGSESAGVDPVGEEPGDFDFELDELEADLVPGAAAIEPVLESPEDPESIAATLPPEALEIEAPKGDELATLETESTTVALDPRGEEPGDFDFEFDELEPEADPEPEPSIAANEAVLETPEDPVPASAKPPLEAPEPEAIETDKQATAETGSRVVAFDLDAIDIEFEDFEFESIAVIEPPLEVLEDRSTPNEPALAEQGVETLETAPPNEPAAPSEVLTDLDQSPPEQERKLKQSVERETLAVDELNPDVFGLDSVLDLAADLPDSGVELAAPDHLLKQASAAEQAQPVAIDIDELEVEELEFEVSPETKPIAAAGLDTSERVAQGMDSDQAELEASSEQSEQVEYQESGIDPVLFKILRSEVAGHLGVMRSYLSESSQTGVPTVVSEPLLRAVHTLNGAIAMVDIATLAQVTSPLEGYVKRLRLMAKAPSKDGVLAIRDSVVAVESVIEKMGTPDSDFPDMSDLSGRLDALRDSLPEPENIGGVFAVGTADAETTSELAVDTENDLDDFDRAIAWSVGEEAKEEPAAAQAVQAESTDFDFDALEPDTAETPQAISEPGEDQLAAVDAVDIAEIAEVLDEVAKIAATDNLQTPEVGDAAAQQFKQDSEKSAEPDSAETPQAISEPGEDRLAAVDAVDTAETAEVLDDEAKIAATGHLQTPEVTDDAVDDFKQATEQSAAPEITAGPASVKEDWDRIADEEKAGGIVIPEEEFIPMEQFGDIDEELLEIFLEECEEILDESDHKMVKWREEPENHETVVELQRALHTLKGGSRMVGLTPIGDLSHAMESLFEGIVDDLVKVSVQAVEVMEQSFDRLHQMLERVSKREAVPTGKSVIAQIETLISGKTLQPAAVEDKPVVRQIDAKPTVAIKVSPPRATALDKQEAKTGAPPARPQQELIRVRADLLDNLVNYAGEVSIYRSRLEQQIGTFRFNLVEFDQTVERLREQLRKLEIETEAQILSRFQRESEDDDQTFDPLELDRFSQLQQLSRALAESVSDLVSIQGLLEELTRQSETLLLQQSRVSSDLQEGLMRTRMVPFDSLVPRLRRILRQTTNELGKKAQLRVEGAQGEMDRTVLDRITAPLEHMLRNSVAHGIETPAERIQVGKPAEGLIKIAISREATEVVIKVSDDGAGIDAKRVRQKAIERGLLKEDAKLSERDIFKFILNSGFSTADEVSKLSGRGVGMDVVSSEIKQLGGTLDIEAARGVGTRFTIRLPFTLAVTQAIMIKVSDSAFALPLSSILGVSRIVRSEFDQRINSDDTVFEYNEEDFQLQEMSTLLGLERSKLPADEKTPMLMCRVGEQRAAIRVDEVIGSREIVVKSVGPQISSIPGIFGATIMGDGSVMMILDVGPLIRRGKALQLTPDDARIEVEVVEEDRPPLVMMIDDSITMRKVTTRVLERNEMDVFTAKDGVDAVEQLQDRIPDLMLLDIEMPRMDGYEVATHVRNDPRLKHIPIIMITSRTGDKHRKRAMDIGVSRYLGKPYQEADLVRNIQELLEETALAAN